MERVTRKQLNTMYFNIVDLVDIINSFERLDTWDAEDPKKGRKNLTRAVNAHLKGLRGLQEYDSIIMTLDRYFNNDWGIGEMDVSEVRMLLKGVLEGISAVKHLPPIY